MKKTAIVTGASGQDGSILCELLIERDYKVVGLIRRKSNADLGNLNLVPNKDDIEIVEGDIMDLSCLCRLGKLFRPKVFINTAAQSHVGLSFETPVDAVYNTGVGVLNCLESLKTTSQYGCSFLQLSTSEMFGGTDGAALNEASPMIPKSPYAAAKLYGYHITKIYRESYGLHASNIIAFNHEEPGRRGPKFVTRKITLGIANLVRTNFKGPKIVLGNLDAKRDWGRARDYCGAMIKIVEAEQADDYVVATGETHSVREFLDIAFKHVGVSDWSGFVEVDQSLIRPNEVHVLLGDHSKISNSLGWQPTTTFTELVQSMVNWDLDTLSNQEDNLVGLETPGLKILARSE
jgi:GDPmannose 4,6-dehydratase